MELRSDSTGARRRGGVTTWTFWLPDEDRSPGWADHGHVLRFVASGTGETPEIAWQHALSREGSGLGVPEGFELPQTLIASRNHDALRFRAGARRGRVIAGRPIGSRSRELRRSQSQ